MDPGPVSYNPQSRTPESPRPNGGGRRLEDQPTVITTGDAVVAPNTAESEVENLSPRLAPGSMVGPYEILEYIGGGGMGRVFRAYDSRLSRTVALKILTAEQAADPQILARFQNEARSAARLNHPGIVQVYSAGEQNGYHYIASEFVEGKNLRKLVEDHGPLPVYDALKYVLQVAEALHHASQRGVIHRDVKPSNIIITPNGQAKLIDLGLARVFQGNGRGQDLTTSGMTLGTFDYIAPEQARDPRLADVRSDIYSLGCTLYFLLTGQPPFPSGTVLQKLLQHQSEEPPNPKVLRPEVPDVVVKLLRRMMAKSPRQRFQSAEELVQTLRILLGEEVRPNKSSATRDFSPRRDSRWRRHLPWAIPVAILLGTTLVLDRWWSRGTAEATYYEEGRVSQDLLTPFTPSALLQQGSSSTSPSAGTNPTVPPSLETTGKNPPEGAPNGMSRPGSTQGQTTPQGLSPGSATESAIGGGAAMANPSNRPDPPASQSQGATQGPSQEVGPKTPTVASPNSPEPPQPNAVSGTNVGAGGESVPVLPASPSGQAPGPQSAPSPTSGEPVRSWLLRNRMPGHEPSGNWNPSFSVSSDWVRIVDPQGKSPGSYPTLEAACQAALPGDEIRLDFDGRLETAGGDLRGKQFTIRPAKGRFPELVLRSSKADALRGNAFWLVAGSCITFEDVPIRVELSGDASGDPFAMFRITRDSQLEFTRCVLTWVAWDVSPANSTSASAVGSFFQFLDDSGGDLLVRSFVASGTSDTGSISGNKLVLTHCVVSGETDLIRSTSGKPFEAEISESFLSLGGRLVELASSSNTSSSLVAAVIKLHRVTAYVAQGLLRQTLATQQQSLPLRVESENCIFVANREASFVVQEGAPVDVALRLFTWFGRRNFYEQFTTFWTILPGIPGSPALELSYDYWRAYWRTEHEQDPAWGAVPWRSKLPLQLPPHAHRPSDFALVEPKYDDIAAEIVAEAGCPLAKLPPVASSGFSRDADFTPQ